MLIDTLDFNPFLSYSAIFIFSLVAQFEKTKRIESITNYFKSKKKKGLEPLFFEKIGDQKTPRDVMRENLIKALEKNGWTIKNKKERK